MDYKYKAMVTKVYDGNSVIADIFLGFDVLYKSQYLKLKNIVSPDVTGEEKEAGLISRDALTEKILGKEIIIETEKDKMGKYNITIWLPNEVVLSETNGNHSIDISHININEWLVKNKYAEHKIY